QKRSTLSLEPVLEQGPLAHRTIVHTGQHLRRQPVPGSSPPHPGGSLHGHDEGVRGVQQPRNERAPSTPERSAMLGPVNERQPLSPIRMLLKIASKRMISIGGRGVVRTLSPSRR